MKRYTDTVLSIATGLPLIGATVTVYLSGTTTKATLYASNDEAGATLPNPVINRGGFSFYAKDGKYDLAIKAGLINRLLPDVDIYDLEELSRLVRERPAKGDPGGNVMDVGPFSALADISVPLGTTQVRTSGNTRAWLIEDTTLTDAAVAAHPLCITKTRNGRYFRLDDLQTIPITAAGAVGGALNPDLTFNLAAIDCRPALLALLAYARFITKRSMYSGGGLVIEIPSDSYWINGPVAVDINITIQGHSTGLEGGNNSILYFPANVTGLTFHHYPSSSMPGIYSASGSLVKGITLIADKAGAVLSSQACGILARTRIQVYNCYAEGFAMDGFSFRASSDGFSDPLGNANLAVCADCTAYTNGRAGFYYSGYDASAGSLINPNAVNNGAWPWFINCFLPMRVDSGHAANNGGFTSGLYPTTCTVFNKGKTYYAVVPADPADFGFAQAAAYPVVEPGTDPMVWREMQGGSSTPYPDAPQWVAGGAYICGGQGYIARGSSHHVPYTEGGGAPYWVFSPSFTIGGIHGAGKEGSGRSQAVNLGLWSLDGGQELISKAPDTGRMVSVRSAPDPKSGFIREVRDTEDPNVNASQQWLEWQFNGYWAFGYNQSPYTIVTRPGTPNAAYMGLNAPKAGVVTNLYFSIGDENGSMARLIYIASAQPGSAIYRARGQTYINSAPVRGGPAGWVVVAEGSPGTMEPTGIVGAVQASGLSATSTAADIVAALKAANLAA
jgi:hypothetical protein